MAKQRTHVADTPKESMLAVKQTQDASTTIGSGALAKIIRYNGKKDGKTPVALPQTFIAHGNTYSFSESALQDSNYFRVRCNDSKWIEAPNKAMWATPTGVVFFDPTETCETRVMPGTEFGSKVCSYGNICSRNNCPFPHPVVCKAGVECPAKQRDRCKFLHPEQNSVVPLGKEYPLWKECTYGTGCTNKTCNFAHPRGRMAVPREKASVFITHTLTLEELPERVPLALEFPDAATSFQFQGEFVFYFEPYVGTWAKNHYQKVIVHRFDKLAQKHKFLGEYTLDGHYCNCVVGAGRYLVISFWPYEEEAIRTIWECLKIGRSMEKELKKKDEEIKKKDEEIKKKDEEIKKKDEEISRLLKQLESAHKKAAAAKESAAAAKESARQAWSIIREKKQQKQRWRNRQLRQEWSRNERLRARDPIHIYTLTNGSGAAKEDWTLVLEYHKGAHDIKLGNIGDDGAHALEITENESVFLFNLIVPQNIKSIDMVLPVVPGKLCDDF